MSRPHHARRGFTLLETILAAAIGLMLTLAVFSLLGALTRSDDRLGRRSQDAEELARLQTVMRRSFLSLAMSDTPPPPDLPRGRRGRPAEQGGGTGASPASGSGAGTQQPAGGAPQGRAAEAAAALLASGQRTGARSTAALQAVAAGGQNPEAQPSTETDATGARPAGTTPRPAPRLVLGADASARTSPPPPPGPDAPTLPEGVTLMTIPPRLEVVLNQPPVPRAVPAEASRASAPARGRTHRGVFEFIAETPEDLEGQRRPLGWALYWRPMSPVTNIPNADGTALTDALGAVGDPPDAPVLVARGIASAQWRAFRNNEKKTELNAIWARDLPGYVEMEVRTVTGTYANWMFEIDWNVQGEGLEESRSSVVRRGGGRSGRESNADGQPAEGGGEQQRRDGGRDER